MYLVYADFRLQSWYVLLAGAAKHIRHAPHSTISVRCRPCIFRLSDKRRSGTSRFIGFAVSRLTVYYRLEFLGPVPLYSDRLFSRPSRRRRQYAASRRIFVARS